MVCKLRNSFGERVAQPVGRRLAQLRRALGFAVAFHEVGSRTEPPLNDVIQPVPRGVALPCLEKPTRFDFFDETSARQAHSDKLRTTMEGGCLIRASQGIRY